jgi:hypothetical protein
MSSVFDKVSTPVWCEGCDKQGYALSDEIDQPCFIVCPKCGFETSYVWCPKCEMGGGFVRDIAKRPISWSCPDCRTEYTLSASFYRRPISLCLEDDLPDADKAHVGARTARVKRLEGMLFAAIIGMPLSLLFFLSGAYRIAVAAFAITSAIMLALWLDRNNP